MPISKKWEWDVSREKVWLNPSEESFCIAQLWKQLGVKRVLDFGCGLGRHAIFFAQNGFDVSAFDLSEKGVDHLKQWAAGENLAIDARAADMLELPYPDDSFDAIFAYHVISHTDSEGIVRIIDEIKRVLRPGGRIFITLCSKETWSFKDAGYPIHDDNTVIKTCEGPENGIPHFYVALDDIFALLDGFEIERIRHVDDCFFDGRVQNSKHYFISAKLIQAT